ncbi:Zan [Anthophora quadrimaculata]
MGARMSWLILLQPVSSVLVHGYDNVGFDGWYQPVPHRPVDIITDVINDLGVRILQQYTAHGNVAFSPTGVGFVLAALYEGSAGRGRQQIADALGLPRDKDITRIGFRDIHRRLRTYLNADGFLGGLTLNQENTKLRAEYEDILRFYGFNLSIPEEEMDETTTATTPVQETTTGVVTEQSTTLVSDETITPTTATQNSETTMMVEMIGMTLNTMDAQDRLTQTTPATEILMDDTSATVSTATTASGTQKTTATTSTTITTQPTTSPTTQPTTETSPTTITTQPTTETPTTTTPTIPSTTTILTTTPAPVTTSAATTMDATIPELTAPSSSQTPSQQTTEPPVPESTTTMPTMTAAIITTSSTISLPINVAEATMSSTIPTTEADEMSTTVSTNGPAANENTVSTDSPNNQSIPSEIGSTDLPVTTSEIASAGQLTTVGVMNRKKRSFRTPRGFFSSYPDEGIWMQDLGIWKPYSPNLNEASVRDSTEISFLVNGCDVSSVTASRYFAVLPFAYFPSLHAVALEFPLDDPRYNILLMMATDRRDTYRLARDLGGKSLRLLRKQLQATWVRATIPSFMLRGFVTLTSFLQRLGILDVFEPRAADLSPMTPDLGVYARDVQQSIGVNIRNYMKPDRTHSRNGLFERAGPVPFTVVHPFLYFIVDAETSVALIAGRVNDPLNSRIL